MSGGQAGLILLGVTLVCGSITLVYPFGRDQLYYAFIGDALLHGKILYRDIPMMQMPLTGVVHALSLVLFGRTMTAIRILDLLWTLATAWLVFLFIRKSFGRSWLALAAGCLYPILYYSYDYWYSAQVDGFLNLPVAAACWLVIRALVNDERRDPNRAIRHPQLTDLSDWFLSGILIGLALFFKYTIVLILPAIAVVALRSLGWRVKDAWRRVAALVVGCLLVIAGALLLLAVNGGLPGFVAAQLGMVLPYAQVGQPRAGLPSKLLLLLQSYFRPAEYQLAGWLAALGAITGIGMLLRPSPADRRGITMVFLWLLAALFSILIQGKLQFYHYLVLLPPVAILGALALAAVGRPLTTILTETRARLIVLVVMLAGLVVATPYLDRFGDLVEVATGRVRLRDFWAERFVHSDFAVGEYLALADYIRDNTGPKDRVTNFGLDPGISFPAWREPRLRYTSTFGLDPGTWTLPAEFIADPPDVFIVKHEDRIPWVRGSDMDSYEQLLAFTQLRDFISDDYELAYRVGHFDILRRFNSDDRLPQAVSPGPALDRDLSDALTLASSVPEYKTIIWPVAVPPAGAVEPGFRAVLPRLISQRTLNRALWLKNQSLDELLPAMSVWIEGDDRPFATQEPFVYQDENQNYISGSYRFTRIFQSRDGLVLAYRVDVAPAAP